MGQQASKHNEAFAFTGNNVLITIPMQPDETKVHDPVLEHPGAYDLTFSGLAKDLAYIDQTYYARDEQIPQEEQRIEGLTEITVDQRAMPSVSMNLTGRALVRLGPRIGTLYSLTQLNLSHNQIQTLPKEIGNLVNLRVLNLSYNRLISVPDTMHRLKRLRAINLSHNQLESIPSSMGMLSDLLVLIVNNNAIRHLPSQLGQLPRLATLHIAHNSLLESIPAEIADMPSLKKLVAHACNFPDSLPKHLPHDPPSLVETCARLLVKQRKKGIPKKLSSYLAMAKTCTACKGPYFDTHVRHHRIVHRVDTTIAIDYRLCSLHWTTENDRLLYIFSSRQMMPNGAVDTYAAEMRSNPLEEELDVPDDDSYYYCRLVPSNHESLESERIPAQKGAGPSTMHLFATRFL
ncbi:hypothetical protein BJV82DRAFT_616698 [Fennellomyces sp. T-0311]|nr:hypothetical protein BJV82DRAFT_616698 [Fennellomyces sp. T-0311]